MGAERILQRRGHGSWQKQRQYRVTVGECKNGIDECFLFILSKKHDQAYSQEASKILDPEVREELKEPRPLPQKSQHRCNTA